MKKTTTINVYTFDYSNKNYLTSVEMPKYKQLKRIKKYLINFIKNQQDMKHKKVRFYCFDIYHDNYKMKLKETDLNFID